ncbi:winged helix-turn-helix domain-containing protein [Burkholderia ubonensis]|uniref:winged helix-turn-helix domain-containing protein n=1 Tax=Burkholderia ubonensis TaxID=101571 RepID=UPI00075426E9|nr:winged helix-turn-helix domain-containing protein [Burkholderia ubonensis]KWN75185.1 hypothetical protein WM23_26565 [Burkholderia ubonensis]
MKQIEREGSAQRQICELLERQGAMTINEVAAARGIHPRATARRLDVLMQDGFVSVAGSPKRYERTGKPIPPIAPLKLKSARIAERRRREAEAIAAPFRLPEPTELERVMSSWVGACA